MDKDIEKQCIKFYSGAMAGIEEGTGGYPCIEGFEPSKMIAEYLESERTQPKLWDKEVYEEHFKRRERNS